MSRRCLKSSVDWRGDSTGIIKPEGMRGILCQPMRVDRNPILNVQYTGNNTKRKEICHTSSRQPATDTEQVNPKDAPHADFTVDLNTA